MKEKKGKYDILEGTDNVEALWTTSQEEGGGGFNALEAATALVCELAAGALGLKQTTGDV